MLLAPALVAVVAAQTPPPAAAGEIVFLRREKNHRLAVFKVPVAGGESVRLFGNSDSVNGNCLFPRWSADGKAIQVTAMKDGQWAGWAMAPDGTGAHVVPGQEALLTSVNSRSPDLQVGSGEGKGATEALYRVRDDGKKTKLYQMRVFADGGAISEATWDPTHTFVTFQVCDGLGEEPCKIMIVDGDGRHARSVAKGQSPDWGSPTP